MSDPPPASTATANVTAVRAPNDGVPQDGGTAFGRRWKLSVGPASGASMQAMDLSLLDFEFSVEQAIYRTAWKARIKVWNVGDNIISQLNKQLSYVFLEAGYQSPSNQYGKVFQGEIAYFRSGKQDAVDTFVEIFAASSDTAVNMAVVNTWLKVGWTTEDQINAVMSAMQTYGVELGQLPSDLNKTKRPRGLLMFGMARDFLRDIERTERGHFFIDQQGKMHFLRDTEAVALGSETVPVLNKNTGLIGVPTTTMEGAAQLQCLLNPNIQPGGRIKVNNQELVKFTKAHVDALVDDAYRLSMTDFSFKPDGLYTVAQVRHEGQTRGNPWYSHITTLAPGNRPGVTTSAQ